MGLEEDIVQSCVKHMNDCAKRIEQLKNLRVHEDYEAHIKPLVNKEIEKCVDEYLNSLTFLTQKIEEYDKKTIDTAELPENAQNQEELTYKLLIKLLQINGLIDEKGNLSEKGTKLLKKKLTEDETEFRPEIVSDKKEIYRTSELSKHHEEPEKDEIYEKSEKTVKSEAEKLSLEDELRYLIKFRGKAEPRDHIIRVICPSCLSKVEFGDRCPVCGYIFKSEKSVDERISDTIQEKPTLDSTQATDKVQDEKKPEKSFQENVTKDDLIPEAHPKDEKGIGIFVNFVSILSIILGVTVLSGCLFTGLMSIRGLEEGTASLLELLYLIVDTLPGIPFSSDFLVPMSFMIRIFVIALSGILLLTVGFGLRRDNTAIRYLGVSVFLLSSLVDIYSIIIIDFSETIVPFLGLIINIVLIYVIFSRLLVVNTNTS